MIEFLEPPSQNLAHVFFVDDVKEDAWPLTLYVVRHTADRISVLVEEVDSVRKHGVVRHCDDVLRAVEEFDGEGFVGAKGVEAREQPVVALLLYLYEVSIGKGHVLDVRDVLLDA